MGAYRIGIVLAAVAVAPQSAAAANVPCWHRVLADWTNGSIARSYSADCYADALKHLPTDMRMYSDAGPDIRRAMLAAIRSGTKPPRTKGGGTAAAATPVSSAQGNSRSLPLPILAAITLALTLLAAGLVGRLRSRRRPAARETPLRH